MTFTTEQNARAIFMPAFADLSFETVLEPFLEKGGCSVLIGESREEYVARRMSTDRVESETADQLYALNARLRMLAPHLIVAVDQELGGIQRLEGLAPGLPGLPEAISLDGEEVSELCYRTAKVARELGVTMFLAPIADVVDGTNPWLERRTLGPDMHVVSTLVAAFVKGVQKAGVTAVTKHFPGFNNLTADPALVDVSLHTPFDKILENSAPFKAAIEAGTKAIMTGPAPVAAVDVANSASTSAAVIDLLRNQFGFHGLIVSDDLDAPAILRGKTLIETAIASVNAGADLLLVAGGPHLDALCDGIVAAVGAGRISEGRLSDAANRVRANAAGL